MSLVPWVVNIFIILVTFSDDTVKITSHPLCFLNNYDVLNYCLIRFYKYLIYIDGVSPSGQQCNSQLKKVILVYRVTQPKL